jgi:NADP-dependent 3-hydroxy acid dehydrogenase YdfG
MQPTKIELDRAVVAVTGAGRGIGRATAALFAGRGAQVHIGDLDFDAARDAAEEIGDRCEAHPLDVTSRASFGAFIDASGALEVLVNNAGIMPIAPLCEETDASARAIVDVNLHGPLLGMKLALPGMIERGRGHVVNVASYAGRFAIPGLATYCASKAAAAMLTEVAALELRGTGVTVTAVLPSAVETELSSGVPFPFAAVAKVKPHDVARAIVDSVAARPREVAVPRWLAGYEPLAALLPSPLERLARSILDDDRGLTRMDREARAAYIDRIERQTRAHEDATT